ncbi:MAG: winged helix-turn-helix domain-containing protein [Phreatobacter sp.]
MADHLQPVRPVVSIRIDFAPGMRLGPGKADLLEGIAGTGSIAAAGRQMGMSYKRAWMLVEALNAMFRGPLVVSTKGGRAGGGAELTDLGRQVLAAYRRIEAAATADGSGDLARLASAFRPPG